MSKVVKLDESTLRKLISESVKNVLNEISTDPEGWSDMGRERRAARQSIMQSTGYEPREKWAPSEGDNGERMICDVMVPGDDIIHKVAIYSSKHFVYDQGVDTVKALFPGAKVLGVGMGTNPGEKWC